MAVSPSLLAADFTRLATEIGDMTTAGADLFHLDVMDGHFVPNLTFGPFIVAAIRRCTELLLDTHLMMTRPDRYISAFAEAGADALTIHVESACDVAETLAAIGELGLRRGLSLNPDMPIESVQPYLGTVDLVLVMSVPPGFGGQSFDVAALDKMRRLVAWRDASRLDFAISVDGGVNDETAPGCRDAGADILVSGSHLFAAPDRAGAISRLRGTG
ncbi:ribulose-phosphate 3-epimerase [bacterium]|nr:ribulose-phosphate 3-epimerase [bacterium]MBU1674935.1 ribulose-phosphate 3-epimerase [bacterium]